VAAVLVSREWAKAARLVYLQCHCRLPVMKSVRTVSAHVPSATTVAFYNAVPSVLWSVLAFGPVVLYCYRYVARPGLWWLVGISLLAYAWPAAWLRHLQLSRRTTPYQQLGHFTQQGGLVNWLLRRRYPGYRALVGRRGVARLLSTTYQQERFHWAGLVFFLVLALHAAWAGRWGWAGSLSVANVGYNLYPIWLQQYLRLRLGRN